MLNMTGKQKSFMKRIVVELGFWLLPVSLFLLLYGRWAPSWDFLLPHIALYSSLAAPMVVLLRLIGRVTGRFSSYIPPVFGSLVFLFVSLFYALVIIAVNTWNQLPTFELVWPYISDLGHLLETLSLTGSHIAALVFLVGCYSLVTVCLSMFLFGAQMPGVRGRAWFLLFLFLALSANLVIQVYGAYVSRVDARLEPITYFYSARSLAFQNHGLDFSVIARNDAQADAIRETYKVNEISDPPNVIVITVDALRADRLGVNGYLRKTTPNIARFFERANHRWSVSMNYSICAESTCGIYGILSSRYLHELSRDPVRLPEVLSWYGYENIHVLSGDHRSFTGLDEVYSPPGIFWENERGGEYSFNDDRFVISRIEGLPAHEGRPSYMYIHLMSAHVLGERFLDPTFLPQRNYGVSQLQGSPSLQRTLAGNYYDNGIAQADWVIGEILSLLEEKGYLENAIVAIVGDHGEMLGEDGSYKHARGVSQSVLSAAQVIMAFGQDREVAWDGSRAIGFQVDLAPTLLRYVGASIPESWRGIPLQSASVERSVFFQQGHMVGVFDVGRESIWKYWRDLRSGEESYCRVDSEGDCDRNGLEMDGGQLSVSQLSEWRRSVESVSRVVGYH